MTTSSSFYLFNTLKDFRMVRETKYYNGNLPGFTMQNSHVILYKFPIRYLLHFFANVRKYFIFKSLVDV